MSIDSILVTGAAGFIGGRVTHRIALGEDASVTPLVHSISGAGTMRVGRLPVDIEQGSILDRERMEELLEDCDAVINCAHGGREATIDGTRTLLAAAEAQNVDSYIHMSSAVVHGHDASGTITEETPFAPDTDYAERKVEAEKIIQGWDGALEPTTFRPCIVYGPHSPWVTNPIQQIRDGAVLADGGIGDLNQVYVDNLVDALLAALGEPEARGEVFMVADDEPVTWCQYYQRLGELLDDQPPVQALSTTELAVYRKTRYVRNSIVPPVRFLRGVLTAPSTVKLAAREFKQTPWAPAIYRQLPEGVQDDILARINSPGATDTEDNSDTSTGTYQYPPTNMEKMQSTRGRLSTEKLQSTLDWKPRISFEQSMEFIADWADYHELTGKGYSPAELAGSDTSQPRNSGEGTAGETREEMTISG